MSRKHEEGKVYQCMTKQGPTALLIKTGVHVTCPNINTLRLSKKTNIGHDNIHFIE